MLFMYVFRTITMFVALCIGAIPCPHVCRELLGLALGQLTETEKNAHRVHMSCAIHPGGIWRPPPLSVIEHL